MPEKDLFEYHASLPITFQSKDAPRSHRMLRTLRVINRSLHDFVAGNKSVVVYPSKGFGVWRFGLKFKDGAQASLFTMFFNEFVQSKRRFVQMERMIIAHEPDGCIHPFQEPE